MKTSDFKKAKKLEENIRGIRHILAGLADNSFYSVGLTNIRDDANGELAKYLGRHYPMALRQQVMDDLEFAKLKLEAEFRTYVTEEVTDD